MGGDYQEPQMLGFGPRPRTYGSDSNTSQTQLLNGMAFLAARGWLSLRGLWYDPLRGGVRYGTRWREGRIKAERLQDGGKSTRKT